MQTNNDDINSADNAGNIDNIDVIENTENNNTIPENEEENLKITVNPVNYRIPVKKPPQPVYKTAAVLGIITFVTALILALLHSCTQPVIESKLEAEKQDAAATLFGGGIHAEELTGYEEIYSDFDSPVTEVLTVKKDGANEILGYCVTVAPKGFGGKINMMVAVNPDGTVKDTEILDMNETPGQGTKINDASFRDQFVNKTTDITIGGGANSIDAIAGATVSSRAFVNGVNSALAVVNEILSGMSDIPDTTSAAGNTKITSGTVNTTSPSVASATSNTSGT